jgi:hypothetical protein
VTRGFKSVDWVGLRHRNQVRKRVNKMWDQMEILESKMNTGPGRPFSSVTRPGNKRKEH